MITASLDSGDHREFWSRFSLLKDGLQVSCDNVLGAATSELVVPALRQVQAASASLRQGLSDFIVDFYAPSSRGIPAGFHSPPSERVTSLCVATAPQERREQRSWPAGRRAGARSKEKVTKRKAAVTHPSMLKRVTKRLGNYQGMSNHQQPACSLMS